MEKSPEDGGVLMDKNLKPVPAPLLLSSRLSLAIICLLGTLSFMFQRLTINFGLVCMVKTPLPLVNIFNDSSTTDTISEDFYNALSLSSSAESFSNFTTTAGLTSLTRDGGLSESEYCRMINARNRSGNGSNFEEGEFDWSRDVQGAILASFYYGFTFSQIPGGWFSDRFGAKPGLLLSGLLLSLLSLLTPISAYMGPEWILTLRLFQGIVNGAAFPAISILSCRWFADIERGLLLGIAFAGSGIAAAIAYPIAAFFCEYVSWPWIFYFGGLTGLIWCVATMFFVFDWPENHPRISQQELNFIQGRRAVKYGGTKREKGRVPWGKILLSLPVWALLVANFCTYWSFLTISMYLPTYMKEVLYLDISDNGLLSALPYVGMMSFHFIAAIAFDKLRKRNLCSLSKLRKTFNTIGSFASALSMIGITLVPCDYVLLNVLMITFGQLFLEFNFMGGYLFSIFEMAPKLAGSLTALMNTFGLLVGFLAPAVVSWLTPNGSGEEWLWVFYISAGINIFGGLFYLFFGTCELQSWDGLGSSVGKKGNVSKDKEIKVLQIKLINGESNLNGEVVRN